MDFNHNETELSTSLIDADENGSNMVPMMGLQDMGEILERLFDVQRRQLATVFFELAGHVEQISVRVYRNGWIADTDPSYSDTLYITDVDNDNISSEYTKEQLLKFKNNLFSFLDSL